MRGELKLGLLPVVPITSSYDHDIEKKAIFDFAPNFLVHQGMEDDDDSAISRD